MTGYGLASYDAVHAASAIAAKAIVTLDTGFALLPPASSRSTPTFTTHILP
jgi:predicted nucleic acid-binding protein